MSRIKPFKVEFVDPDTMCVVDGEQICAYYDHVTGQIIAFLPSETPEFDKELEIRVKE